ncbi:VPLPA-CTERM sorting domain-containing protein [Tropicimonas sp. TH_r6]|nr:VPLPA-CTERM sorting domain-containing protein [Tropicimonas sp. TH_r6]
MDFETASTGGCQVSAGGSLDGFTFAGTSSGSTYSSGFNNTTSCSFLAPTAKSGSQFVTNYNSRLGGMEHDTDVFSLNSLWVRADERVGASTVEFIGYSGSLGSAIAYSMTVDITNVWSEVIFSGWDNLKSFAWDAISPGSSNISIDDITYVTGSPAAVPLPAGLPLLLAGLGAIGVAGRRQKARKA